MDSAPVVLAFPDSLSHLLGDVRSTDCFHFSDTAHNRNDQFLVKDGFLLGLLTPLYTNRQKLVDLHRAGL